MKFYTRIIGGLLGTLVMLGGLLVATATPAAAATSDKVCVNYHEGTIRTCLTTTFTRQADGTGVRLESYHVETVEGCSRLEGTDPYADMQLLYIDPDYINEDYVYNEGNSPCNLYRNVSNAGSDGGAMDLRFYAKARIDFGADRRVYLGIRMQPDGSSNPTYSYTGGV